VANELNYWRPSPKCLRIVCPNLRNDMYVISRTLAPHAESNAAHDGRDWKCEQLKKSKIDAATKFIPLWSRSAVALARTRNNDWMEANRRYRWREDRKKTTSLMGKVRRLKITAI